MAHIADVVFVGLEGQFFLFRQIMELARGLESVIDQILGHAVAANKEKADVLGRELQLFRHRLQGTGLPGQKTTQIKNGNFVAHAMTSDWVPVLKMPVFAKLPRAIYRTRVEGIAIAVMGASARANSDRRTVTGQQ